VSEFLLEAGKWDGVTPESAGWRYLSFEVRAGEFSSPADDLERVFVPLGGTCRVEADGETWGIGGRENVFGGMPSALYLPRDTEFAAETDGEVAVCAARCERKRDPVLISPEEVEIEVRGSGNATRQINHIVKPEFPAERILVVEVYTPAGNWSSYPPHKHDEDHGDREAVLEETYYYRTREEPHGAFAMQRLYSPAHELDLTVTVRDGDLLLVPYGYHTTCAAHGYDLYYLNALAGDRRTMAAADDPELAWIRSAWARLRPDPRVPLVTQPPGTSA
jgi:5-deoxy-glucuronate isomerase